MNEQSLHRVRVAVVQLTCHPSFIIGGRDHAAEPYFATDDSGSILAKLLEHSFSVDDLQLTCRNEYLLWHMHRVRGVLAWLEMSTTRYWGGYFPDILVFPEGSIPAIFLNALTSFARKHKCAIFAGTHALVINQKAEAIYDDLSFWDDTLQGLHARDSSLTRTIHNTTVALDDARAEHSSLAHEIGEWEKLQGTSAGVIKCRINDRINIASRFLTAVDAEVSRLSTILTRLKDQVARTKEWLQDAATANHLLFSHDLVELPEAIRKEVRQVLYREWRTNDWSQKETLSVLPIIRPSGHIYFRAKEVLSPFEFTGHHASSPSRFPVIPTVALTLRNNTSPLIVAPYICAEALRVHHLDTEHVDLAVVVSFNKDFSWFAPIVQHTSANRIPVIYSNDGHYGDSGVICVHDERSGADWWLGPTNRGRLPPGDSVLVMDVTCGAATDVNVADPHQHYALVSLSAVIPRDLSAVSYSIAKTLERATTEALDDGFCKEKTIGQLRSLANRPNSISLQTRKLERLQTLVNVGADQLAVWKIYGNDCVFGMSHE